METSDTSRDDPGIVELTKEGYALLKEHRLDEAEGRFKAIVDLDAKNAYALSGLGDIARKKNDFTAALGFYSDCLKAHPDNNYAMFGAGDCHRGLNDHHKAIDIWNACLERDPGNPSVINAVADAYRKLFEFDKAKKRYEEVLSADPENEHALKGLGYLHYDFKRFKEAIPYWKKLAERAEESGGDTHLLALLGTCYRRTFDYRAALRYYETILSRDPGGFTGNFGLADCYRGLRDFKLAREYYEIILRSEPDNQSILSRAGDMCLNLNDMEGARRYFEKSLAAGDDIYARFGFAHIEQIQGNYRKALRLLREMDERYPNNRRIKSEIEQCERKLA